MFSARGTVVQRVVTNKVPHTSYINIYGLLRELLTLFSHCFSYHRSSQHTLYPAEDLILYRSYHFVPQTVTCTYSTEWQHRPWSNPCTPCTCCEFHYENHSATKYQNFSPAEGTSRTPGITQEHKSS